MTRSDHVRLGIFIIVGTSLLVLAAGLLAYRHRDRPHAPMVTYFDESVSGLMRGSTVRFRGVEVGQVEGILIQRTHGLIEVRFQIFTDVVGDLGPEGPLLPRHPLGVRLMSSTNPKVANLRIRLKTNPITGQASLEVEPFEIPSEAIAAEIPKDRIYLPSAPSVTDALVRNVEQVLVKMPMMIERFDHLVLTVDQTISGLGADQTGKDVRDLIAVLTKQVAQAGEDLKRVLKDEGPVDQVLKRADATLAGAEVGKTTADLRTTFADLRAAAGELRLLSEDLRGNLPGIRSALDQIRATLRLVNEQPESLIHGPRKENP